ncbi:MAG: hypothetical protein MZV70_16015 [Desulfobacterales bacterium]|nr:hypothetical protein [Desulfobacterales bacterium]
MVALTDFSQLWSSPPSRRGIDFIFSGAGLPLESCRRYLQPPAAAEAGPHRLLGPGRRGALQEMGEGSTHLPDAFVVEGPLAGGHLGFEAGADLRAGVHAGKAGAARCWRP